MGGLILLVFIAIGLGWFCNKGRKRLGFPANGKTWLIAIIACVIVIGVIYGSSQTPHP